MPEPIVDAHASPLPSGARLFLIVFFSCVALLLQALDSTIVSTAIPSISEEFNSSQDVGWYGSAYFLTQCVFQIFWGRLYTFFDFKRTYLIAILVFEIGSLLCAVAPLSAVFIVGRAIAGVGAGGVFTGSFVLIAFSVPLVKRPLYASILGAVYGVASVLGPPIGGAFASDWTWRGCFYINLPLGGIVAIGLILFLHSPEAGAPLKALALNEKLKRLDPFGSLLLVGSVSCVLLALQWGGQEYAWDDPRIIVLLILFVLASAAWAAWQIYLGDKATIPKRIVKQRSLLFVTMYSFTQGGVNFVLLYNAPIWFQAVRGASAATSGLDILPYIAFMTATMMGTGYILTRGGYSAPFMLFSIALVSIAAGLLTRWTADANDVNVFGVLSLYGFGQGFGWQQPILIAQTMLPTADIPTGTSTTTVCKLLGGTIFVSVAQTLFDNKLAVLAHEFLPQLDPSLLSTSDISKLRSSVSPDLLQTIAYCYNEALRDVWWLVLALSLASIVGASGVEWRNVTDKVAAQPVQEPVHEPRHQDQFMASNSNSAMAIPPSTSSSVPSQRTETKTHPLHEMRSFPHTLH